MRHLLRPVHAVLLLWLLHAAARGQAPAELQPDVAHLLQQVAKQSPDPCMDLAVRTADDNVLPAIFSGIVLQLLHQLNTSPPTSPPADTAHRFAVALETESASINASWPDESRLHLEVLDLSPVLVVKIGLQTTESYYVLGIPDRDEFNRPNHLWRQVGTDRSDVPDSEKFGLRSWISVYPLHRGPSQQARLLARVSFAGCAGSSGLLYEGKQWDSRLGLTEIIHQNGALGMDQAADGQSPTSKDPFHPVGVLRTKGSLVALPYCWFSAIDTWDNPSLCAVDTYNVAGDSVTFVSRAYNRPDLIPIARVLEAMSSHDYPAIRAYCASELPAQRLFRYALPIGPSGDLQVHREGTLRESVVFGDGERFTVQKRRDRWLITAYAGQ